MPPINTYIVEIEFQSGGNAVTSIQAESADDAEILLESLCDPDEVEEIDVKLEIRTYKTRVEVAERRRITAYIQAKDRGSAERLFKAMYGPNHIGQVSEA